MTLEELQIKFSAETSGLNSELSGVKQAVSSIEAPADKAQSSLVGFAKIAGGAIAGAAIGKKLIGIGKDALLMANEVTESENLFEVTMGEMADDVRKWSDDLSKSLGLNAYTMRKNTGTMNVMFKSMGMGTKQAGEMAKELTLLSEDMASFYNLNPDEMFNKLQSGITGEVIGLRRLGILVDETTIKHYALREGIIKQGQEMTSQQKIMARYGAIMEQTKEAQGDLAATIESPANQLRVLSNQFDQAKIALGQALQPAMIAIMPVLTGFATGVKEVVEALSGIGSGDGNIGSVFDDITVSFEQASQRVRDIVGTESSDTLAKINELKKKTADALNAYVENEKKVKQIAIDINIDPPTTTGEERIKEKIDEIETTVKGYTSEIRKTVTAKLDAQLNAGVITQKQYNYRIRVMNARLVVLERRAEKLAVTTDAKINAALADGEVKEKEAGSIEKAVTTEAQRLIKAIEQDAEKQTKEIDMWVAKGEISAAEGLDLKESIETWLNTSVAAITANVTAVKAEVGTLNWQEITFTEEDVTALTTLIENGIETSTLVVDEKVNTVNATFLNTGVIGRAVTSLYSGLQERVTQKNDELSEILDGWKNSLKKPTAEDWAKITEIREERDRLMRLAFGETTAGGELTGALVNLGLNQDSISNYFKAFTNAFDTEKNAALATLETQKSMLLEAYEFPEFENILASMGLAGLSLKDAIAALEKQTQALITKMKSDAIRKAIAQLGASIKDGFGSEDFNIQAQAYYDLGFFLDNLNLDELDSAAKAALIQMLDGIKAPDNYQFKETFGGGNPFQNEINELLNQVLGGKDVMTAAMENLGRDSMRALDHALRSGKISPDLYDEIILAAALGTLDELLVKLQSGGGDALDALKQALLDKKITQADYDAVITADSEGTLEALRDSFKEKGNQAMVDLINAIIAKKEEAAAAVETVKTAVELSMSGIDATDTGSDFIQGFINGMQSKYDAVGQVASKLAGRVRDAMNNTLVVQSPSRVAYDIGGYVGEGLALGMQGMERRVYDTSARLAMMAERGLMPQHGGLGLSMDGSMGLDGGEGNIPAAIAMGVADGVQRVMDALDIHMRVDGTQFGRLVIRTVGDFNRRTGQHIIPMGGG